MSALGFLLKKLVSRLLFPVGLCLSLGLAGILLWRLKPGSRWGPGLVMGAWGLLLALSLPITGETLLGSLEGMAGDYADPAGLRRARVERVVVLGGGVEQGDYTTTDRLTRATLKRVLEGIRLWRELPGAKLVLAGGNYEPGILESQAMGALALEMGVPPQDIVLEGDSWDTEDQAARLRPLVGDAPFALVTSAFHMPRSLALLRDYGLKPLPAPTDFALRQGSSLSYRLLLPGAGGLRMTEVAVYEYIGLAWRWLKRLWSPAPGEAAPGRPAGKPAKVALPFNPCPTGKPCPSRIS